MTLALRASTEKKVNIQPWYRTFSMPVVPVTEPVFEVRLTQLHLNVQCARLCKHLQNTAITCHITQHLQCAHNESMSSPLDKQ